MLFILAVKMHLGGEDVFVLVVVENILDGTHRVRLKHTNGFNH